MNSRWRWAGYALIGVCLAVAILVFSLRFPNWKPTPVEKNLTGVVLATMALFGYVLQWGWRFRRYPKFWLAFGTLAIAHCAAFVSLSFYAVRWPILLVGPVVGVEAIAIGMVILWTLDRL